MGVFPVSIGFSSWSTHCVTLAYHCKCKARWVPGSCSQLLGLWKCPEQALKIFFPWRKQKQIVSICVNRLSKKYCVFSGLTLKKLEDIWAAHQILVPWSTAEFYISGILWLRGVGRVSQTTDSRKGEKTLTWYGGSK